VELEQKGDTATQMK